MTDAYGKFLTDKIKMAPFSGFEIARDDLHPWLKPHVKDIVQWGVRGGRRAYFTRYGLHKTSMQLETGRQILRHAGGRGLIVLPLGVRQEFWSDARHLDMDPPPFIRSLDEARADGLHLTNYETIREGKIDPATFTFVSLDEADALRSYGSKTFQTFLPLFEGVPYRFVATATPDPNRHKELIHYAGFLGVMDTGQALTRFFQRNPEKANDLTLYPHKVREFWLWVHSWATFLQRPSDLGHSDDGYELPPLTVRWHEVAADLANADVDRDGQGRLMRDAAIGVQDAARERRDTLPARIAKVAEIRHASPDDHFILWHDLEAERHALEAALPDVVSVYGTQELDDREAAVLGFKEGLVTDLAAKPVMLGAGPNLQPHCHRAIFAGVGFKARDFVQAIHRIYRFGQAYPVQIDVVYAETEREVRRSTEGKLARMREQEETMSAIIREFGLDHVGTAASLARSIGVKRQAVSGAGWMLAHNDTVDEAGRLEPNSVGLIVTSIPFANHYEYTPSYNDFGHTEDNGHFWAQMDFLTPKLIAALQPGRILAIHTKDRVLFGNVTGAGLPTISPFHAEAIFHGRRHGLDYVGMITVVTDVVTENNGTYRLGYSEMLKDGTKMGVGSPEYVVLFHRPQSDRSRGYADEPVAKDAIDYSLARWQIDAHAFWRSSGDRLLTAAELGQLKPDALARVFTDQTLMQVYDHEAHVGTGEAIEARRPGALPRTFMALAPGSPDPMVWHDVLRMGTLNADQAAAGREKHVCPLQFDIVDRLIRRFSNPGDLVYDPFGGLGTVPLRALMMKRRGRSVELHGGYWQDSVAFLQAAEREASIPTFFDLLAKTEAA